MGWVYWTGMVISMSSEATAVSLLFRTWFPTVSIPVLGTILILGVTLINLLGASQLSSLESLLAGVKLLLSWDLFFLCSFCVWTGSWL